MATDLLTRQASSKSDAFLQRKFHELSARIRRVDRITHVLTLLVIVLGYALVRGWFDWFAGNSQAAWVSLSRWLGFAIFLAVFGVFAVRAVHGWFRRVNPYYVAHLLEDTVSDAKNSLINWLDLHDEELPTAFQKHLSARAAEQWEEGDAEQTVCKRQNWVLLSVLAGPIIGLIVLIALSPSSAFGSLLHAFVPFYTPTSVVRTRIEHVEPKQGDVEVSPTQAVPFKARIEGRIPGSHRPDVPKLYYRYQDSEDYLTQPLHQDDAGLWTTQLLANQLRTGFTYKLGAGDAETPEHRVSVRGRAHVKSFEIAYEQRPYLQNTRSKSVFPNQAAARPIVNGMRGAKVEMTLRASQPVGEARIEIVTAKGKIDLPTRKLSNDASAFVCQWTLEQSGHFRVIFTTTDGEANVDRELYPIDVRTDESPTVVLTQPAKDVSLPENGFLELLGRASDDIGVKSVTLHVRVVNGPEKFASIPYRPDKSFRLDEGTYPDAIDYQSVLALDQLKDDKGTIILPPPGRVLEYWLEALDNSDYPNAGGNPGKSDVYKITLMKKSLDPSLKAKQQEALQRQKEREQKQDQNHGKQSAERKNSAGGAGPQEIQKQLDAVDQANRDAKQQLSDQLEKDVENKKRGGPKGAEPPSAGHKDGPQNDPDSPKAEQKDQPPMSPGDTGNTKDGGKGSGDAKDGGEQKKKDTASKGDSKPPPKKDDSAAKGSGDKKMDGNPGGANDAGATGMDTPMPAPPRDNAAGKDAPAPSAKKSEPPSSDPQHGDAKGIDQNGPDIPNKDAQTAQNPTPPPGGNSKSGKMPDDAGASKPGEGGNGQARDDVPQKDRQNPSWDDILKLHAQLQKRDVDSDAAAKTLAEAGKNADDPRKREAAQDALANNGRDPKTGVETKKGPNPGGTDGTSAGLSDDNIKAAVAKREFAAKIGQMQLDDWKKRVNPELLKKAGMTEADWQRFLKNTQSHDALVRQLNAQLLRGGVKKLAGSQANSGSVNLVEGAGQANDTLDRGPTVGPPELSDAIRRFNERKANP